MIFSLGGPGDMMEPIMKIIQMVVPMFMSPGKNIKINLISTFYIMK